MTGRRAEMIGRRIALHLRKNHFEGAHIILDYEEKRLNELETPPEAIAELNLPLRVINMLEEEGYMFVKDLIGVDFDEIMPETVMMGEKVVDLLKGVVGKALEEIEQKRVEGEMLKEQGVICADD